MRWREGEGRGVERLRAALFLVFLLDTLIALTLITAARSKQPFTAHSSVHNEQLRLHLSDEQHSYHISLQGLPPQVLSSTELLFTITETQQMRFGQQQKPVLTVAVNSEAKHGDHEVEDQQEDNKHSHEQYRKTDQPSSFPSHLYQTHQLVDGDQWNEDDSPIWTAPVEHTTQYQHQQEEMPPSAAEEEEDQQPQGDDEGTEDNDESVGDAEDDEDEEEEGDEQDELVRPTLRQVPASRSSVVFPRYAPGVQPLLSLVMIVKNEAAGLEATLRSTFGFIDHYSIVDTGSTDDTVDIIRAFYASLPASVTHALHQEPFVDFSTTRNRALYLTGNSTEFVLMMNGDDRLYGGAEMRTFLETRRGLTALDESIYIITIDYGGLAKGRSERLARTSNHFVEGWPNDDWNHWRYEGVTHEAYVCNAALASGAQIIFTDETFGVYHDITNDTPQHKNDRFLLDIELLIRDLQDHPNTYNTPRNMYYLAQSYYNLHRYAEAKEWYLKRVAVNYQRPTPVGEDNEKQRSYSLLAYIAEQLGENESMIEHYWKKSYEACPTAYALYNLGKLHRDQGQIAKAKKYADKAKKIIAGKGSPIVCNGDDVLVQKQLPALLSSLRNAQ